MGRATCNSRYGAAARSSWAVTSATHPTFQQETPASEPIPLTPLSGLTSLDATVDITVNGTIDGKPTQGGLTATLTSNDQGMSQIDVTGSLLGSRLALRHGSGFVRVVFIVVVGALILRTGYDAFLR